MIVMSVVTALVLLALVTQAGVVAVQRAFPPQGEMVDVDGARLHIVDIGPRAAESGPRDAGLPIVMLHGASPTSKRCDVRSAISSPGTTASSWSIVPAMAGARARGARIPRRRSRRG